MWGARRGGRAGKGVCGGGRARRGGCWTCGEGAREETPSSEAGAKPVVGQQEAGVAVGRCVFLDPSPTTRGPAPALPPLAVTNAGPPSHALACRAGARPGLAGALKGPLHLGDARRARRGVRRLRRSLNWTSSTLRQPRVPRWAGALVRCGAAPRRTCDSCSPSAAHISPRASLLPQIAFTKLHGRGGKAAARKGCPGAAVVAQPPWATARAQ
jgi:hypothetical protein